MAKNIGTLAIMSKKATLLSENCCNCKCFGTHVFIAFVCTRTTQLGQISHKTQKWTGQTYCHPCQNCKKLLLFKHVMLL